MKLEQIMTSKVVTLNLDDSVGTAYKLFQDNSFHHIVIVDESNLVLGVLTDRDLYKHVGPSAGTAKATARESAQLTKKLNLIMTRDVSMAPPSLDVKDALLWIDEKKISCIPVVDDKKQLLGIVTWRDIVRVLANVQRKQSQAAK
ncbi:CBS domain-containing protein [Thalassotalea euphylliae]|uniref:CBS domain-containing protein n=1 Tax=Thalassotalea euphylliae TaxID=1655234 RepID=UPI00363CB7B1